MLEWECGLHKQEKDQTVLITKEEWYRIVKGIEDEMGQEGCFVGLSHVKNLRMRSHHREPPGLASPLINLYFISWAKESKGRRW